MNCIHDHVKYAPLQNNKNPMPTPTQRTDYLLLPSIFVIIYLDSYCRYSLTPPKLEILKIIMMGDVLMSNDIDSEKDDILQEFTDFLLEDYYMVFKNSNNPNASVTPITDEELDSCFNRIETKKESNIIPFKKR